MLTDKGLSQQLAEAERLDAEMVAITPEAPARVCRHCRQRYGSRVGRGLCSTCYKQTEIRGQYQPLAPFGGSEAGAMSDRKHFAQRKESANGSEHAAPGL